MIALHTKAFNLHRGTRGGKAGLGGGSADRRGHAVIGNLSRGATAAADQKLVRVVMPMVMVRAMAFQCLGTAHEGIQPFQPMDKALFQQEIERAIHRRRCRLGPACLQLIEQRIGPNGRFRFQHQAQDFPPQWRKLNAARLAKRLSPFQRCQMMC